MLSMGHAYSPCGGIHGGGLGGRASKVGRHAEAARSWAACSKVGEAWRPTHNTTFTIVIGICLKAASPKIMSWAMSKRYPLW